MQPISASVGQVLADALRSTPFQAVTACAALLSLVLAALSFWRTHLRRGRLRFLPADSLGLVRAPLGGLSGLHLMGALVNEGAATAVLQRLEADVSDNVGGKYRFLWQLFYRYRDGGDTFDKVSDPYPLAVKPGDSVPLHVQLRPVDGKIIFDCPKGEYLVRLTGWAGAGDRLDKPRLRAQFRVSLDRATVETLANAGELYLALRVPVVEWRHPEEVRSDPLDELGRA